jgi:hypothetical protein
VRAWRALGWWWFFDGMRFSRSSFPSYSLVTKRVSAHPQVRRSPPQAPRGLLPWTAVRSSRARALRVRAVHPTTHIGGGQCASFW